MPSHSPIIDHTVPDVPGHIIQNEQRITHMLKVKTMHRRNSILLQTHTSETVLFSLYLPVEGYCRCYHGRTQLLMHMAYPWFGLHYLTLIPSLLLLKLARSAQPLRQPWAGGCSLLPFMEHAWEQLLELLKECTPLVRAQV